MAIFISYSHSDKAFVDELAFHLVQARQRVWLDRWELRVGDSLIQRIEQGIAGASALIVVLSHASVQSEWCRKELSAGLIRELEEKRIVVLPVLIEDCDIPLFLRDKLYADFRSDRDEGLRAVLEALARFTTDTRARVEAADGHIDWAIDWVLEDDRLDLYLTIVEHGHDLPYTVLTQIRIIANERATRRYVQFAEINCEWFGRQFIVQMLAGYDNPRDLRIWLGDDHAVTRKFCTGDPKNGIEYDVEITSRLLGDDTGKDVILDLGKQIHQMATQMRKATGEPTSADLLAIRRIIESPLK